MSDVKVCNYPATRSRTPTLPGRQLWSARDGMYMNQIVKVPEALGSLRSEFLANTKSKKDRISAAHYSVYNDLEEGTGFPIQCDDIAFQTLIKLWQGLA